MITTSPSGGSTDLTAPGPIGGTTPAAISATTLAASGAVTGLTYNGLTITTTTSTLTLAGNLVTTGSFNTTFAQAATTTITLPATSATMARTDAAQTFTGTQTFGALTATGAVIFSGANILVTGVLGKSVGANGEYYANFGGSTGAIQSYIGARFTGDGTVHYPMVYTADPYINAVSVGWGSGITFKGYNASNGQVTIGTAEFVETNVTAGSVAADFVIQTTTASSTSESLRIVGATKVLQMKTGTQKVNVGGAIFDDFTAATTTSTNGTEDDLFTHTLVASTLGTNGDKVEQVEHVSFVSSATAARRIKKYFGGTMIFDSTALTLSLGGEFDLFTTVIRVSSTVVSVAVSVTSTSASSIPYSTFTSITGLTLSNTQILKTTGIASGTGAASGDIINRLSSMVWLPAAS